MLRWPNGESSIPPSVFIPIAEESGLIIEVGEFVLQQGFQAAVTWSKERLLHGRIAINVSARQLTHIDFLMTLDRVIQETQCDPSLIELEITESSILENPEKNHRFYFGLSKEKDLISRSMISVRDIRHSHILKISRIDKLKIGYIICPKCYS